MIYYKNSFIRIAFLINLKKSTTKTLRIINYLYTFVLVFISIFMKKIYLILLLIFISSGANSQTFTDKDLQKNVLKINTAVSSSDYDALFKKFSTANTSEKWQAYYYSAVSLYMKAEAAKSTSLAEFNGLALKYAMSIVNSAPDNIEISILIGLAKLQRIRINASPDAKKDAETILQIISKAESVSPNNPRLTLLKAGMAKQFPDKKFDQMNASQLQEKAVKDFDTSNSTDVTWGKQLLSLNK